MFRTPVGQRFGDLVLLVLIIPLAGAAAALLVVAGVMGVAGAVVVLMLVFRFRGWPAWTLELEEDGAVLGPFPRHRVPYEDITFIAAGTRRGWTGHHEDAEAYPLRVETRSGRVVTLRLKHSHADKALLALHERARNATALDAAIWAPVVWLAFAGGIAVVPLGVWGVVGAAGEGEWGAAFGALLIGGGGG
jgi:hypothetical protein